jgi:DNA-binding NarL/FixJ family response regulator
VKDAWKRPARVRFKKNVRVSKAMKFFNMILLDYNMPSMNGLEGLRKEIALKDAQRVILIWGEATRQISQDALAAGVAGFVHKSLPAKSHCQCRQTHGYG